MLPNDAESSALDTADRALIEVARALMKDRYDPGRHEVVAALRTRTGRVHLGVHLECEIGRIAVCAEAIAVGRACTEGEGQEIATIVAVRGMEHPEATPEVIPPCGMCREMIFDYAPNARVIVPGTDGPRVTMIADLLPQPARWD